MGKMLVFTNAVEGRDDEYNQWNDEVHLAEVLALPEFVGATRHKVADAQLFPDLTLGYVAIYEYKGDASVAVEYHGHSFWIPDTDIQSKAGFGFVMLLFSISGTGVKSGAPVVTVPAQ